MKIMIWSPQENDLGERKKVVVTIHLDDNNGRFRAFCILRKKKLDFGKVNRKGGVLYCMYLHPSLDCVQSEKKIKAK